MINYLQRHKTTLSLNDVSADAVVYPARQEERVFEQEQRDSLQAALANLTKRELRRTRTEMRYLDLSAPGSSDGA